MAKKTSLDVLREKLEAFQKELAITADPNLKLELNQRIESGCMDRRSLAMRRNVPRFVLPQQLSSEANSHRF